VAVNHIDRAVKQACDVFLEANVFEHSNAGGRIDFDHNVDVAVGLVVAPRERAEQGSTSHPAGPQGGFGSTLGFKDFATVHDGYIARRIGYRSPIIATYADAPMGVQRARLLSAVFTQCQHDRMQIRDALPEDGPAACIVLKRSIAELCEADHRNDPAILAQWSGNKTQENFYAWVRQPDNSLLVAVEKSRHSRGRIGDRCGNDWPQLCIA
jgi:hypothetical protein